MTIQSTFDPDTGHHIPDVCDDRSHLVEILDELSHHYAIRKMAITELEPAEVYAQCNMTPDQIEKFEAVCRWTKKMRQVHPVDDDTE